MSKCEAALTHELQVQCLLELGEGHVNIIRPTELLLSRTHLALVTEYAPGGSLADYLKKRGALPEAEASYFFRQVRMRCAPRLQQAAHAHATQVVAALQFCHAHCVVYRDVKPENTLLCGANPHTVALCDFGVARRLPTTGHRLTTLAGTPGYFAPQVLGCMFGARDGAGVAGYDGAKADVWGAGALLSELLLRRLPYDFDVFAMEMQPSSTLRDLFERARSQSWRESADAAGRPLRTLTPGALALLEGMLHPKEAQRLSLVDVAEHPWTRQPLGPVHEAALAGLEARQMAVKRQRRMSGVYCRADGDGIIAALVSRAAANKQMSAADAPWDEGAPECIRLKLEEVPRMQCPPSLAGAPMHAPPPPSPLRGAAPSPMRISGAPPRKQPPSPTGVTVRPRSLAVAAVDDSDIGDGGGYVHRGKASGVVRRLAREEGTV